MMKIWRDGVMRWKVNWSGGGEEVKRRCKEVKWWGGGAEVTSDVVKICRWEVISSIAKEILLCGEEVEMCMAKMGFVNELGFEDKSLKSSKAKAKEDWESLPALRTLLCCKGYLQAFRMSQDCLGGYNAYYRLTHFNCQLDHAYEVVID